MHQYIRDTAFAVANLLHLATAEENELKTKASDFKKVEAQFRVHKWNFESSDLNDDFSDGYVMAAFGQMARSGQATQALQQQLAALQASIDAHQQAVQAIAAAILQIAKQGISVVHGGLGTAPEGRKIGSLPIRDIIWQARNQALHYEEGKFKKPVVDMFATLALEQDPAFSLSLHPSQGRAKQVLALFGWTDYVSYERDIEVLLP